MKEFISSNKWPLLAALAILCCLLLWRLWTRVRKYSPAKRAEKILEAIRNGRDIRIVYWSKSRRQFVKEIVTPESLKGVYMKAHDHARGITRKFNITRVREVVVYPHPALGSALIPPESHRSQHVMILSLLLVVAALLSYLRYDVRRSIFLTQDTLSSVPAREPSDTTRVFSNDSPVQASENESSHDVPGGISSGSEFSPLDARARSSRAYYDQAFALSTRGTASGGIDFSGVIEYCTKAIESDPYYAQAHCLRALARVMKGDFDGAITDSTKAVELNPRYSQAYYIRGGAHDEKGETDAAVADFTEAIRVNPQFADAFNARAWAQYRSGKFDAAIEDVNQAIQLNPKSANAYDTRGWTKYARGDKEGALADCSRAVQLDPQSAVGYNSQGLLHYITGEYNEALLAWNQTMELSPSAKANLKPWIEKAQERLRK